MQTLYQNKNSKIKGYFPFFALFRTYIVCTIPRFTFFLVFCINFILKKKNHSHAMLQILIKSCGINVYCPSDTQIGSMSSKGGTTLTANTLSVRKLWGGVAHFLPQSVDKMVYYTEQKDRKIEKKSLKISHRWCKIAAFQTRTICSLGCSLVPSAF